LVGTGQLEQRTMSKGTWWRPQKHSYVDGYGKIDWAAGRVEEAKELMEMIEHAKRDLSGRKADGFADCTEKGG